MRAAEIDRLIRRSPCIGIELPREAPRDEVHFLAANEVTRLTEAIDPRFRALIFTAAYGGLRAGELAALKVEDVDTLRGVIKVTGSIAEVGGQLVTGPTKTNRSRRVPIPRFLAQMIGEHIGAIRAPTATSSRPRKAGR